MSGDQNTLNVHGACATVSRPTTRMSTPMSRIQSGIAYQTSPSGRPDANDRSDTESVRGDRSAASRMDSDAVGGVTPGRVDALVRCGDRLDHEVLDEVEHAPAMAAPVFGRGG